jgi:outer membrane protein assembly factor BamA
LNKGNLPTELLTRTGYKPGFFKQRIINFSRITKLFASVLAYAENNGYPFASIKLKELEINGNQASAGIDFNAGPYITFDSLKILNTNKIKSQFLAAYLKIKPGSRYDQRKIDNITTLIDAQPYLIILKPPELYFANEKCQITLDLKDEKASAFDGIVGLLPNENEEGKLLVTGQVYLKLENLFRSGKRLELNWRKMNIQSQELSLMYDHPALLRMPLDLTFVFELYKQDTTFLSRKMGLNLFYNNYRKGRVGIRYERDVSRLLETESLSPSNRPFFADYNLNFYGLAYKFNSLDHQIFPTRGWRINLSADLGHKNIIKNSNLDEDFYEEVPDSGLQWKSMLSIHRFFSLRPRNILQVKLNGGYMDGDQLFLNDLFRLGGLHSIRGFNEMFFYASGYVIGTLEYRYLFENESQLLVFFDGAFVGHDVNNEAFHDYPLGFGVGINISTGVGLLNVVYAMGRSKDQPLNVRYSKIHIGYTGRF